MKKIILLMIFCGLTLNVFAITPGYHGARSLSLGYASTALNHDVNGIFINPSLLSSINNTIWGYQYQHNYQDYKNYGQHLSNALAYNLKDFENLEAADKSALFSKLKDIFQSKTGMSGFRSNVPGYVSRNYGFSVGLINTAIINPVPPEENLFDKAIEDVSNEDIASLKMNIIGLSYKRISLSYSTEIQQNISLGVTLHYLNGKITEFNGSLVGDIFTAGQKPKDYLEYGWDNARDKFSKLVADAGVLVNLGRHFNAGVVYKNFASAKIQSPTRTIALNKRIIAGLAFKPNAQWGVYVDMDLKKSDLLYNGQEMQPISIGIEKGFFNNRLSIRAGMLNDLTEEHLFGKKSNALYGMGIGFNMGKFVVDAAIGIDSHGMVKSMAISGFILMK